MKNFTRKELRELEKRALELSEIVVNEHWKRLYLRLADVLNEIDACLERTKDSEVNYEQKNT